MDCVYFTELDDGVRVDFRLIRPTDKDMLVAAFERLSERSRYYRFFRHLRRLSEKQLRYLTEVDHVNHSAWIALARAPDADRGAGVCRWIRIKDRPSVAEVAVTVVDEYQRRGLGRTLLYLAVETALDKGVETFEAWVLAENHATLRMLEHMGAGRGRWEQGVLGLTVPLDDAIRRRDLVPLKLTRCE